MRLRDTTPTDRPDTLRVSRRVFVSTSCAALGLAAFRAEARRLGLVPALAARGAPAAVADYKALVCIYLSGGNDGNNMVIPMDAGYTPYANVRQASGLAIAEGSLLPMTPPALGVRFGLHPSLAELHTLWGLQKLAVVCNVGTLVQPLTRAQYQSGAPRPYQLFSHSDQVTESQTARADLRTQTGWGGRVSDTLTPLFNAPSTFPMVTSVSGTTIFAQGATTRPLSIAPAPTALNQVLVLNGFNASAESTARRSAMNTLRTLDRSAALVAGASDAMQQAVDIGQAFSSDPILATTFPNTSLGNQLKQVAKLLSLNQTAPALGIKRQIFFCSLGGFDTHQNQVGDHVNLYGQLSQALKAFYDATVELSLASKVTTFTLSDFGRTLQPSGSGSGTVGTDHAWGNHAFVLGGAVTGGNFYGVAGPSGNVFPVLQLAGPSDTDNRGRWIPTVAVEQYAATLASWMGVPAADLPTVFPLLGRFAPATLGFLA